MHNCILNPSGWQKRKRDRERKIFHDKVSAFTPIIEEKISSKREKLIFIPLSSSDED